MLKFLKTFTLATVAAALCGEALAAPSAVGKYGGFTEDNSTAIGFETTARGTIKNVSIVALRSLCTTTLPGQDPLPAEERSTNITKREVPTIRLRSNSGFSATFELPSTNRVDFRGASVQLSGRLRGKRGTVSIVLQMNKTYEDGSTEVCGGSVTIPVQRGRR
jgi:hypothetical protein